MTEFIAKALIDRPTGLSLHYPFLHAAVVGMGATSTLEFGAGGSTRVFLDAAPRCATHYSISTETQSEIVARYGVPSARELHQPMWFHLHGKSDEHRGVLMPSFDLILHDGSHAADVVASDIAWAWPHLKRYGLLLVHDSQHSYCGAEVREGIRRGMAPFQGEFSMTTLPYGFGLTIIRREVGGPGEVVPGATKVGSPHRTEPVELTL